jgi:hypothetical protein
VLWRCVSMRCGLQSSSSFEFRAILLLMGHNQIVGH